MKEILHIQNLTSVIKGQYLFFDTSSLIAIINHPDLFEKLIADLLHSGCTFSTIPSVVFEFTRSDSLDTYDKRIRFIKTMGISVYPIERHLNQFDAAKLVFQKINPRMSYTDFLLYLSLYKFSTAYLITENHKDFLTSILDRKFIISIDTDIDMIRNLGFYQLSDEKYQKAAQSILRK